MSMGSGVRSLREPVERARLSPHVCPRTSIDDDDDDDDDDDVVVRSGLPGDPRTTLLCLGGL